MGRPLALSTDDGFKALHPCNPWLEHHPGGGRLNLKRFAAKSGFIAKSLFKLFEIRFSNK
jgi:hypothetical protein